MKNLLTFGVLLLFLQTTFKSNAQTPLNENQLMTIQFAKVSPSNSDDYRKAVKEFVAALTDAEIKSAEWYAHWQDNYTYLYAVPIDNMGEFDGSYWEEAIEKIGREKFFQLTNNMESKIEEQKLTVYQRVDDLSYQHKDYVGKVTAYREWNMIQIDPSKKMELKAMAEDRIKLYKENSIVANFGYYECAIGCPEGSIAVVNFAESPVQLAKDNKAKAEKIGAKEQALWNEVKKIMNSIDHLTGYYLPELSYLQATTPKLAPE